MKTLEQQYVESLKRVLDYGFSVSDRTGTGCKFVTGVQLKYDAWNDPTAPNFIGKRVIPSLGYKEMLWFLMGKNDKESLNKLGVRYWDKFFREDGTIGKTYGYQMRNWNGKDQLKDFLEGIKKDPYGRRHILTLWNYDDLDEMVLPPCFYNYQVCAYQNESGETIFDLIVTSRSTDSFLGFPYNVMTSLFLGTLISAYCFGGCDSKLNMIIWNCSHFHIYNNHIEQVKEYIVNYESVAGSVKDGVIDNSLIPEELYGFVHTSLLEGYDKAGVDDLDNGLNNIYEKFVSGEYKSYFEDENTTRLVFDGYSSIGACNLFLPPKIEAPLSV